MPLYYMQAKESTGDLTQKRLCIFLSGLVTAYRTVPFYDSVHLSQFVKKRTIRPLETISRSLSLRKTCSSLTKMTPDSERSFILILCAVLATRTVSPGLTHDE